MDYECTISVLMENHPNILTRITSLLARRGFAVDSLAIGTTELETLSRLTLVVFGNDLIVGQITKQLYKLMPVMKVQDLTSQYEMEVEALWDLQSTNSVPKVYDSWKSKSCNL